MCLYNMYKPYEILHVFIHNVCVITFFNVFFFLGVFFSTVVQISMDESSSHFTARVVSLGGTRDVT